MQNKNLKILLKNSRQLNHKMIQLGIIKKGELI